MALVADIVFHIRNAPFQRTFEQYKAISRSEKPLVYLTMTGVYNIFDTESGVNIALEK